MKRYCLAMVLSGLLTCSLSMVASAQTPAAAGSGGAQGGGIGGGGRSQRANRLATRNAVQVYEVPVSMLAKDLALTPDETAAIGAIQTKLKADAKAARPPDPDPGVQPNVQQYRTAIQKTQELDTQADKDITAALTGDQKARLPEVLKSYEVYKMAGIPLGIAPKANLTAAQKKQIVATTDEGEQALQDAQQAAGRNTNPQASRAAIQAAIQDVMSTYHDKLMAILTDTQRQLINAYIFDNPPLQMPYIAGAPGGNSGGAGNVGGRRNRGGGGGQGGVGNGS